MSRVPQRIRDQACDSPASRKLTADETVQLLEDALAGFQLSQDSVTSEQVTQSARDKALLDIYREGMAIGQRIKEGKATLEDLTASVERAGAIAKGIK